MKFFNITKNKILSYSLLFLIVINIVFSIECIFAKTYNINDIKDVNTIVSYNINDSVEKMDTVTFGSYPQTDINGEIKEPIEWIVLEYDNNENKALLLSKYILDCKPYYDNYNIGHPWEESELRLWLNNEFLNSAFDSNDQKVILTTKLENKVNSYEHYGVITESTNSNNTEDKVFCISGDEYEYKYFNHGESYFTTKKPYSTTCGTNYAKSLGLSVNGEKTPIFDKWNIWTLAADIYMNFLIGFFSTSDSWSKGNSDYWLRTVEYDHGKSTRYIMNVTSYGTLSTTHQDDKTVGVRPAIWVDITKIKNKD